MRVELLLLAGVLVLPGCATHVAAIDVRAACDQAFPNEEVKGAERRTVGELREAYRVSYGPTARGPNPPVLWEDLPEDRPAVRCLMRRHDGAVTEGKEPVKLRRLGRS
jgi:hypothetical protein